MALFFRLGLSMIFPPYCFRKACQNFHPQKQVQKLPSPKSKIRHALTLWIPSHVSICQFRRPTAVVPACHTWRLLLLVESLATKCTSPKNSNARLNSASIIRASCYCRGMRSKRRAPGEHSVVEGRACAKTSLKESSPREKFPIPLDIECATSREKKLRTPPGNLSPRTNTAEEYHNGNTTGVNSPNAAQHLTGGRSGDARDTQCREV